MVHPVTQAIWSQLNPCSFQTSAECCLEFAPLGYKMLHRLAWVSSAPSPRTWSATSGTHTWALPFHQRLAYTWHCTVTVTGTRGV